MQLVKETRQPIAATAKHPRRIDYEYERAGTASIFMSTEPLSGWREATAHESKTKVDWALEVARLLDGRYRGCEKVTLVCDNRNTHTKGAFYETQRDKLQTDTMMLVVAFWFVGATHIYPHTYVSVMVITRGLARWRRLLRKPPIRVSNCSPRFRCNDGSENLSCHKDTTKYLALFVPARVQIGVVIRPGADADL